MSIEGPGNKPPKTEANIDSDESVILEEPNTARGSESDPADVFDSDGLSHPEPANIDTPPSAETETNEPVILTEPIEVNTPEATTGVVRGPGADMLESEDGQIPEDNPLPGAYEPPPQQTNEPVLPPESKNPIEDIQKFFAGIKMSDENKELFKNLGEGAKDTLVRAYKEMKQLPYKNHVAARIALRYDKFLINRNESKASKLREKIGDINTKLNFLNESYEEFTAIAAEMEQNGFSNTESIRRDLRDIEKSRQKLTAQLEAPQEKLAKQDRDRETLEQHSRNIASVFVERYNAKMEPHETKMAKLNETKAKIDANIAITEARHKVAQEKLNNYGSLRSRLIQQLATNEKLSESQINRHPLVRQLSTEIEKGNRAIAIERARLESERQKVQRKIDEKQNTVLMYKEMRSEFDQAMAGSRSSSPSTERTPTTDTTPTTTTERFSAGETLTRRKTEFFITEWNQYVENNQDLIPSDRAVPDEDFYRGTALLPEEIIDFDDFKMMLMRYYEQNGISVEEQETDQLIRTFFKEKLNDEK